LAPPSDTETLTRAGRRTAVAAFGAALSLPFAASAAAAPTVCACGGGGSPAADPVPDTPQPAAEPPAEAPPATPPAPAPPESLPRTPDAAEAWLAEPEPEPPPPAPEPPPEPEPAPEAEPEPVPPSQVYGVDADLYRRLGSEDQQAIRKDYESEPAPAPATAPAPPNPEPLSADAAEAWQDDGPTDEEAATPSLPTTPDAAEAWTREPEPPTQDAGRQVYGVDADLYRRLGSEDQQAIRDEHEDDSRLEGDAPTVPPAHPPAPPPSEPIGDGDGPLELPPYFSSLPYYVQEAVHEQLQEEEDARQAQARHDILDLASHLPPEDAQAVRDYLEPPYVALGDSYSAGTGTRPEGDPACERSPYAYGPLVSGERNYQLDFQACGGHTIPEVLGEQVQAVNEDTRVVTISIGGNDAGFGPVVKECAEPVFWGSDRCGDMVDDAQEFIRDELPAQLDEVYDEIRERAPEAEVVVVGYPRIFGEEGDCNGGTSFGDGEIESLNETGDLLADVTREEAEAHGFEFVDPRAAFTGHEVCGDPEYINGLSNPTSNSFHPNRDGHEAYADLVTVELED
jgi:lysophospholipase L1-like esterase